MLYGRRNENCFGNPDWILEEWYEGGARLQLNLITPSGAINDCDHLAYDVALLLTRHAISPIDDERLSDLPKLRDLPKEGLPRRPYCTPPWVFIAKSFTWFHCRHAFSNTLHNPASFVPHDCWECVVFIMSIEVRQVWVTNSWCYHFNSYFTCPW